MNKKFKIVSLFCGCGGIDLGFEEAGFSIISSDDIKNYLEFKDEEPEVVANKYIEDMTKKYRDYRKLSISR
ncbi:unnamed protein product [marine sediment metagenome]|uniref:DNA (cytosine-5-)-methyltransferase n=1 Tax=marine sediment metagenome TaxID=412755 RepID=X1TP40_9ZZZZ